MNANENNETINPKEVSMQDFNVNADLVFKFNDFASTEAEVHAISLQGLAFFAEMFGDGARSITLPKSKAGDLAQFAARKGLIIN